MPQPSPKKVAERAARVAAVLPVLKRTYPDAKCSLDYANPFQLLVATIMAAQCTDERVNLITRDLFRKYPTPADLAAASQEELEADIRSISFYRTKSKNLRAMAQALVDRHGSRVPETMDELTALAGAGRKTANVVLGNAFGRNVGVTVDTHATRLANRLGLTDHKSDAEKIENDLIAVVPRTEWTLWSHLLIYHGRAICTARDPRCGVCPLLLYCPTGRELT